MRLSLRSPSLRRPLFALMLMPLVVIVGQGRSASHGSESAAEANAFLDRFIGDWEGEGYFRDLPIVNTMQNARVLDEKYLRMVTVAIDSHTFESDDHVWFDPVAGQYWFLQFNTDDVPQPYVQMRGVRTGDRLVLEERPAPSRLRFTFEWLDDDTFTVAKDVVRGQKVEHVLFITFHRQSSGH